MLTFVSYKQLSDLIAYYAQTQNVSVYEQLNSFSGHIQELQSWDQVASSGGDQGLFADENNNSDESGLTVFDYSTLTVNPKVIEYLNSLIKKNADDINCLLINRLEPALNAATKKILTAGHLDVVELRAPDKSALLNLVEEANNIEKMNLTREQVVSIGSSAKNYDELINLIYLCAMSGDTKTVLKEFQIEEKPILFMLPWRENSLKQDAARWYQIINAEELQLALSLLMTKTLKWSQSEKKNKVMESLIQLDYSLKDYVRSDITAVRSWLWKVGFSD